MKARPLLSEEKLVTKGVSALVQALGPVEASRFLALPPGRRTESVRRHRQWQARLAPKRFLEDVFGK